MKLGRVCLSKINGLINSYSNYNPSPLSLKQFTDFGRQFQVAHTAEQTQMQTQKDNNLTLNNKKMVEKVERQSYEFLKQELLVRLAVMTKEMLYLPDRLIKTSSVQHVYSWYLKSFEEVLSHKDSHPDDKELDKFTKTLNNVVNRHSEVVQNMAMGILQVQETYGIDYKMENNIQYFLDRFLMSRISIRMLINQHVLMFADKKPDHPVQLGSIDPHTDVRSVLEDAFNNAKFLCDQYYLCSPEITFETHNTLEEENKNIELVYVPSHLYHIAFELYKNAMRAVIEHHGEAATEYPPVKTLIVKGKEDLSIRITDFGGGITHAKLPQVFKYMYSSAPRPSISSDVYDDTQQAPLAGYGYGLPLSRLYARYFQGDLQLCSIDGYSTDAYIYLKTLSKDANESLPVHNKTTENNYKNTFKENNDWTNTREQTHRNTFELKK